MYKMGNKRIEQLNQKNWEKVSWNWKIQYKAFCCGCCNLFLPLSANGELLSKWYTEYKK